MSRAAALVLVAGVAIGACSFLPRPGDPSRLVKDDPRVLDCGIPIADMWMAFAMARASDVSLHFPGWTQGNEELQVPDPALVIIGLPHAWIDSTYFDMCIAIGPPDNAILHRYSGISFPGIRPVLDGPVYPMPTGVN